MTQGDPPAAPIPERRNPGRGLRLAVTTAAGVSVVFVIAIILGAKGAAQPSPGPTPDLPASPVEGVVIAVDSAGLGQVRGFTLRIDGGFAFVLQLGPLENATEFPPSHLAEHMASSERIRAHYELEGGLPVVYRLEDASAPT